MIVQRLPSEWFLELPVLAAAYLCTEEAPSGFK
jgi:hypothetical protein